MMASTEAETCSKDYYYRMGARYMDKDNNKNINGGAFGIYGRQGWAIPFMRHPTPDLYITRSKYELCMTVLLRTCDLINTTGMSHLKSYLT